MAHRTRHLIALSIAAGIVCVVLAVTHGWWLRAAGGALVHTDPPARSEIIVVLGGDYSGLRIIAAAGLVRQGYAPEVLVSGPPGFYGGHECDYAIPFAVRKGYPAAWFTPFPHNERSTEAEAHAIIRELRRRGVHRYLLVTSNYHTGRSARLFRAAGPDLEFRTVAAPDEFFTQDSWWQSREGRKRWLMEAQKTMATMAGL